LDAPKNFPVQPARLTDKKTNSAKKQKSFDQFIMLVGRLLAGTREGIPSQASRISRIKP
jgi:hypothetical protein